MVPWAAALTIWVFALNAVFAIEELKRHPAPISARRGVPQIPASQNVKKSTISLQERGSLTKRGIKDIENAFYSKLSYNVLTLIGDVEFLLALDTGSSDTWVVTDHCDSPECHGSPAYPLKTYRSPSFVTVNNNQTMFNISFADTTSASGFIARESFKLGDLSVDEHALGMVTTSNLTLGQSVSGILGLGFPRLSRITTSIPGALPFLSALSQSGQLEYPLFGLSLTRDLSGTLSMGAIDSTIVTNVSLITWHDVVPFLPFPGENTTETSAYLHWTIPLESLSVNGTSEVESKEIPLHSTYENITGPNPLALFDVGYDGISGPFEDVAAIFLTLGTIRQASPGTWIIPCDTQATMTFTFGGTNITLQPSDYLIGPTQGDPNLCLSWPVASAPNSDGIDWHFGMPLFRAAYTVFSYGIPGKEPPLIGLYPLSNTTEVTTTPQQLASLFSSLSLTIPTTAPAVLLPTPSFTTPAYAFNTSATPSPTLGQVLPSQSDSKLAANYSSLFKQVGSGVAKLKNASAMPVLAAPSAVSMVLLTDSLGVVHTSTSVISTTIPTADLGKPPGTRSLNGSAGWRRGGGGLSVVYGWVLGCAIWTLIV